MNYRRHTILLAIVASVLVAESWGIAVGQPPALAAQPSVERGVDVEGRIEYVGPDTYLLLDAEGRPQPVLGMSYEEFVAAWKQLQRVEAESAEPRYTFEELQIAGDARGDRAELDVELTVQSRIAVPLKVPLGMAEAILLEEPRLTVIGDSDTAAAAKPHVGYEPEAGGYVVWIEGAAGQLVKLSFRILLPLARDGNQTSLAVNLPRALVSRFAITLPTPIVGAATVGGGLVTQQTPTDGGTRLEVDGSSGDFRLSWNSLTADRPELSTVLSATGAIAIAIDGHSIRSDAHLTVRSYGGTFDRFRVRLPFGAQLIQDRTGSPGAAIPSYRVIAEGPSAAAAESRIVTVELAEKQLGPVEIQISTEQPLGLPTAERAMELAGFEVVGALRQFGDVAVTVADDWQLRWENGPNVRQVERADLSPLLRDALPTVAFQYDRQPWSLRAQIVARPMAVHVTPDYRLELGVDEARLRVQLNYQVPGARAFEFHVDLAGWELTPEPIESNGLVDRDRVLVTRDGLLILPLAQASSRRADIAFSLRRTVARNATSLKLPLPVPEADTVAAANLVVAADSAIDVLADMSASRGLSPTPVTSDAPDDAGSDGQQLFHYRSFVADAVFAAKRSVRPSDVTAEVDTQLSVDWRQPRATQLISYRVEHQPLDELTIELPAGWSIMGDQVELVPAVPGSAPIVAATVVEAVDPSRPTRIARITLAQPRLGRFRVRINYEIAELAWSVGVGDNRLSLPQPSGGRIAEHRVELTAAPNLAVSLDASANLAWQPRERSDQNTALALAAAGPAADLPLIVEPVALDRPQSTTVERVWLQTWQAGSTIQDRAAIQFRTASTEVTVELPPMSTVREVEVLIDGDLAQVTTRQEGRLTVEVPKTSPAGDRLGSRHTLELRYRRPAPIGLVTRHSFTPPQLVGTSALSAVYWQVVLPGDRHIVVTPDQLVPVDARQWLEVFTGRATTMLQAELETWSGATSQLGPTAVQNAYLFSGLAPVASIEMLTVPRWLIVFVASSGVLAMVLLWMYLPAVRRGWIAILFAAIIAGLSTAYPDPAVLFGQAAVLGVILASIALLLRRALGTRPQLQPVTSGGSTNLRMRSSPRADSYFTPALSPSHSGTPTTPLAVPELDR